MPDDAATGSIHQAAATPDRLLRLFVQQSREHAILLLDTEGRIVWWNDGAERLFGMPASEAIGQPVSILFTPEDIARGVPDNEIAIARREAPSENDRWLVRRDGSRFWANGVLVGVHDENGRCLGFGKILRNRTDLREQVEALQKRAEASDAASRGRDVFLSTLSHELRNPLAPLVTAARVIRMTAPATPETENSLQIVERQIENLRRLVDDLLDLTRIGTGKIELRKDTVAVQEVVRRSVESVSALVSERRHRLEVLMPEAPMLVEADPSRLEQVFVNLLNNAAKYTPEGGRIWIKGTTEGNEAVVHVQDTGVGIPNEMLPRIFELFTQVESSRPESDGGLGIGLSLVKDLVTLHGGSVQVRSDGPGKGGEFAVRLPLARTPGP